MKHFATRSQLLLTGLVLLMAPHVCADGDNFNDNNLDTSKWLLFNEPTTATTEFREESTVLQCRDLTGAESNMVILGWLQTMPYNSDWSAMIDTKIPFGVIDPLSGQYEGMYLSIGLRNVNDFTDTVSIDFNHYSQNNTEISDFAVYKYTDDTELVSDTVSSAYTDIASLMLRWSAVNHYFTFSIDTDGGQDTFTDLIDIPIADWNITANDAFQVGIAFGNDGNNVSVDWQDNVAMDNFVITDVPSVPEPGAIFLCIFGAGVLLKNCRKKR